MMNGTETNEAETNATETRPRMVTLTVWLVGVQILSGLLGGILLLAADDSDVPSAVACLPFALSALLLLCAVLLVNQRRHDWPRWVLITIEVASLVVALLAFVLAGPGALPGVVVCVTILYALSDPDVINWYGPGDQRAPEPSGSSVM
jgi:drug/metabolite transporter (DMT)-like permease